MNLQLVSDIVFALGRRAPRAPTALLRAMPPGLLRALRAPGLRETFRVATRASYYRDAFAAAHVRSEEHTSELQSPCNLVCRLLLEKKKNKKKDTRYYVDFSSPDVNAW